MAHTHSNSYPPDSRWFAVRTRSRQEKSAAATLLSLTIPHYLPMTAQLRQWSDRKQAVVVPLFRGYLFVRINPLLRSKLLVLTTPGIVGFISNVKGPIEIPDEQINSIQTILKEQVDYAINPTVQVGDLVRVVRGVLAGLEGRLVRSNSGPRLAISVDLIHRSLLVAVSRQDVELLPQCAA